MRDTKSFSIEEINGPDHQANSILKQMYSALKDKAELTVFEQSISQAIEDAYKSNNKNGQITELLSRLIQRLKNENAEDEETNLNDYTKNALAAIIKRNEESESLEEKIAEMAYAMSNMDFSYRLPLSNFDDQNEKYDFVAICLNSANEELQSSRISTEIGEILLSTPKSLGVVVTNNQDDIEFVSENLKVGLFLGISAKVGENVSYLLPIKELELVNNTWIVIDKDLFPAKNQLKIRKVPSKDHVIYQIDYGNENL